MVKQSKPEFYFHYLTKPTKSSAVFYGMEKNTLHKNRNGKNEDYYEDEIKVRNMKRARFLWRSYVDQLANAKLSLDQKKSLSCERISLSAWIGLTDYFAASICLLEQTFPHSPHPLNISNMRKTEKNTDNKNMCSLRILKEMRSPELKHDEDVYSCAVQTFAERMLKFGPHCVKHIGSITPYEPVQARNILEELKRKGMNRDA